MERQGRKKNESLENMIFYRYNNTDKGKGFVMNAKYLLELYIGSI